MNVLNWSLLFFAIALVAGLLGLDGVARASAWVSGIFLLSFLVLVLVSFVVKVARRAGERRRPS